VQGDGVVDRTPSRDAGELPGAAPALQGAVAR
jgi:hypothetical protein